ncbi:exodeoxyribonuclease VII large subunit [Spirulina major CS-329]|uniref:exodeoxyribonuclease VII large subunit n=1 Tax=Spirulina TaxID=1154 RepID=UPI00232C360D|nr:MULTISPECIES: exodeoxyribonuclease VII large subunit [Spirulina]MDB9494408.1 exodeoxyribonuclease VII large subunit [Spirulina subsalsa CS-330]MDB9501744.1 exodeoxyribonuclease VII large subunit [Spirulina major CS-329]
MELISRSVSVAGLTDYIKSSLEDDPVLQHVWVTGEVTTANDHRVGLFLTLADPVEEATVQGVVWGRMRAQLKHHPQVGEQVAVLGSVSLYAKRGEYRLQIVQILPLGDGAQALRLQQVRSRLAAEGLFDPLLKQPLPPHPRTIAVVTAPTAAAWGDIQRTIQARDPSIHILFSPATVQGEQAPDSIATALDRVEADDRAEVIILARGGGATEDLACFNDERVIRAIADCRRPVVTGIGHERDQTLADLVADVTVHTPTAAAERVVPSALQRLHDHHQRRDRLLRAMQTRLTQEADRLHTCRDRLHRLPQQAPSLQQARLQTQIFREKLAALDPRAVLQRGYAIAQRPDGAIVRRSDTLTPGDTLTLKLAQGTVQVTITALDPEQSFTRDQNS